MVTFTGRKPRRWTVRRETIAALIVGVALLALGGVSHPMGFATGVLRGAAFSSDGTLNLPVGFRRWEHVGARVKTSGNSVLDGSVIVTPQLMDTYIEPSAFEGYKKNGTWPEGTQIVKELSFIKTGDNCDKVTFSCATPAGAGIFQDRFIGVGMMVKDSKRFPQAPGNWGYFRFLADGSGYAKRSGLLAPNQCQACHVRFASKEDYVFTNTHIGLTSSIVH